MKTVSRRTAAAALAAAAVSGKAAKPFRLSVCSETFGELAFNEVCALTKKVGYAGIEVDPSQLASDPTRLTSAQCHAYKRQIADAGIDFVGFHSFLKAPGGLHLTAQDASVRQKSWDAFARLVEKCGQIGGDSVMVLGSGKQRTGNGVAYLREGLAQIAPVAVQHRVTVLLEPLAPQFTDNVNTLRQALAIVREINSPGLQTMLDVHNLVAETESPAQLVDKNIRSIRHIHLNEMDGRYPGSGNYPFAPLLQALRDKRYPGWLSIELFDFRPDGETVARKSLNFIRDVERKLA